MNVTKVCPNCAREKGYSLKYRMELANDLELDKIYKCYECDHEWIMDKNSKCIKI